MNQRNLRLLPEKLVEARLGNGASQKALALDAGVDISHLCSLERGRGSAPTTGLVDRLVQSLGLQEGAAKGLRFAAAHDRAIDSLASVLGATALRLVSTAAKAGYALEERESAGAEQYLEQLIRSRAVLTEAAARGANGAPEEDAMK